MAVPRSVRARGPEDPADFIEGYNRNMAILTSPPNADSSTPVIEPHRTRLLLRQSMRLLRDKQIQRVQRKHGLIPI